MKLSEYMTFYTATVKASLAHYVILRVFYKFAHKLTAVSHFRNMIQVFCPDHGLQQNWLYGLLPFKHSAQELKIECGQVQSLARTLATDSHPHQLMVAISIVYWYRELSG